jgi:HSP20 family protein
VKRKKNFSNLNEASELLGEDFWEVMTDILPFIGPRVDMVRQKEGVLIVAEIPGIFSSDDLSINIQGPLLLLEGKIERPYMGNDTEALLDERFNGNFKRKIKLPEDCIPEQMKANYIRGILEVRIPTYSNENTYPKNNVPVKFIDE